MLVRLLTAQIWAHSSSKAYTIWQHDKKLPLVCYIVIWPHALYWSHTLHWTHALHAEHWTTTTSCRSRRRRRCCWRRWRSLLRQIDTHGSHQHCHTDDSCHEVVQRRWRGTLRAASGGWCYTGANNFYDLRAASWWCDTDGFCDGTRPAVW